MATVLGISGSPIHNSNTDQAVQAVLAATGLDTEFIKLSDYTIEPCRACLGCVTTNRCVIGDGGNILAEKVRGVRALVVGGFAPYSSLDARTKAFLERLYPLRHVKGLMAGKVGAAIVTACVPEGVEGLPPAFATALGGIQFYMMEEGMKLAGSLSLHGNVPCIRCGYGDTCPMSGVKMLFGPDATVKKLGVRAFSEQSKAVADAAALGQAIAHLLTQPS